MIKVLVVDDSALMRKLFGRVLAAESDMDVTFARSGVEAMAKLAEMQPDVITLDIQMPGMDGLACLDRIMIERPCPVVMVSSMSTEGAQATLEALRLGAVDFVPKPDGVMSLHIDVFGPELVAKIRSSVPARLRASIRLRERVQHRIGATVSFGRTLVSELNDLTGTRPTGAGVVVVGCSTGGPPALEALLAPLSATFPWPIVVAQHMPVSFTGPLARRLDRICDLAVSEVETATPLEPGRVYIGRGDGDVVISRRGEMAIATPVACEVYPWRPSADRLVRSAMAQFPASQIIGVLMTGMGYDGAAAMKDLFDSGGRTIAEAEESAVVWGMPGELVKLAGASFVLPVHRIASKLQQLAPHAADT